MYNITKRATIINIQTLYYIKKYIHNLLKYKKLCIYQYNYYKTYEYLYIKNKYLIYVKYFDKSKIINNKDWVLYKKYYVNTYYLLFVVY